MNSYKKIMKKIHPDRSPELNNIATLVNQAKRHSLKIGCLSITKY